MAPTGSPQVKEQTPFLSHKMAERGEASVHLYLAQRDMPSHGMESTG